MIYNYHNDYGRCVMGIVYQTDKRAGITYAYENKAYWDKEKKQSRSKREMIGRVDPDTGEIIPTDGRRKKGAARTEEGGRPDYKALYEKLQKKCMSQESLINALRKEINKLKGQSRA
jgi:hypothetical protein